MTAPQLASILDRQVGDADRPKPMPVGTYHMMVVGAPRFDKSRNKGTDFVEFTLKFLSAEEDVDEDDLAEALTKTNGETAPLTDKTMRLTFYLTEGSAYRLDDFLKHLGIEGDISRSQAIAETANRECLAVIRHKPSDDGERIYANIDKTAAVS